MGTELPGNKILVVDDERLVRWSLRQKCEEWGLRTAESKIMYSSTFFSNSALSLTWLRFFAVGLSGLPGWIISCLTFKIPWPVRR